MDAEIKVSGNLPEGFKPKSDLGQKYPNSFAGRSLQSAERLDQRLEGHLLEIGLMTGDFATVLERIKEQGRVVDNLPQPTIEIDESAKIHGAGTFGIYMEGKVNGIDTGERLGIRLVTTNELTDHPTLVNPLVLEALSRERHGDESIWTAVVPFSQDLPTDLIPNPEGGKSSIAVPRKESIEAIVKAIRILETTGQLDHFRDPDPSQFGMLINPDTKEPYRYSDGTIVAFVRDRNAAFENPAALKTDNGSDKEGATGLSGLSHLLETIREKHDILPPMGRIEALKHVAEASVAQVQVLDRLSQEYNIKTQKIPPAPQQDPTLKPVNEPALDQGLG